MQTMHTPQNVAFELGLHCFLTRTSMQVTINIQLETDSDFVQTKLTL